MYPDLSVALSIEDSVSVKGLCVRCGWCVSAFWMLCEGCIAAVAFSHIVSGAITLLQSSGPLLSGRKRSRIGWRSNNAGTSPGYASASLLFVACRRHRAIGGANR